MLHHDLASEETTPLPQRRITPGELQRAVTSLDARRQEQERQREEEAHYLAETLSLEQAASTLSLDYTPEEIWAEIRQEREQTSEAKTAPQPGAVEENDTTISYPQGYPVGGAIVHTEPFDYSEQIPSETFRYLPLAVAALTMVGIIFGLGTCTQIGHQPSSAAQRYTQNTVSTSFISPIRITTTLGDDFYSKLRQSRGQSPRYHITRIPLYLQGGFRSGETLYPERAIPDGYSMYNLSVPLPTPSAVVFREVDAPGSLPSTSPPRHTFVTTRYDEQEYVRCRIRKSDAVALKHNDLTIFYSTLIGSADALPRSQTVPLTVPVGLWSLPRMGDYRDWLHMSHPPLTSNVARRLFPQLREKLDDHVWEDYTTVVPPRYNPPPWAEIPGVFSSDPGFPDAQDVTTKPYMEFDASSKVTKIGRMLNGQQFHCGSLVLKEILLAVQRYPIQAFGFSGTASPRTPLSQILVDARPRLHRPYTFVRLNGNLYLHGWVEAKATEEQLRGHAIIVHSDQNDPELGFKPTQIQICLSRCQIDPSITQSYSTEQTIPVSDIHLDSHAWEKW